MRPKSSLAFVRPAWPASWPRSAGRAKRQRSEQRAPGLMSWLQRSRPHPQRRPRLRRPRRAPRRRAEQVGASEFRKRRACSDAFGRGPAPAAETPEAATSPAPGSTPRTRAIGCCPRRLRVCSEGVPEEETVQPAVDTASASPRFEKRIAHGAFSTGRVTDGAFAALRKLCSHWPRVQLRGRSCEEKRRITCSSGSSLPGRTPGQTSPSSGPRLMTWCPAHGGPAETFRHWGCAEASSLHSEGAAHPSAVLCTGAAGAAAQLRAIRAFPSIFICFARWCRGRICAFHELPWSASRSSHRPRREAWDGCAGQTAAAKKARVTLKTRLAQGRRSQGLGPKNSKRGLREVVPYFALRLCSVKLMGSPGATAKGQRRRMLGRQQLELIRQGRQGRSNSLQALLSQRCSAML